MELPERGAVFGGHEGLPAARGVPETDGAGDVSQYRFAIRTVDEAPSRRRVRPLVMRRTTEKSARFHIPQLQELVIQLSKCPTIWGECHGPHPFVQAVPL